MDSSGKFLKIKTMKILVVDDEMDVKSLFEQSFRKEIKNPFTDFAYRLAFYNIRPMPKALRAYHVLQFHLHKPRRFHQHS